MDKSDVSWEIWESIIQLLADAELSLGFFEGTGLGAFLLATVAIVLLLSKPFERVDLKTLVPIFRSTFYPKHRK